MYLWVPRCWFCNVNHLNINFVQSIFASVNGDMRERRCGQPCSTPYTWTLQIPLACQRQLRGTLGSVGGAARFTGYKRERKILLAAVIRQFEFSSGTCVIFISAVERTWWFTNLVILTYLLTPWSRVLLEKLTSKLCS